MSLILIPLTLREANAFVFDHHRHSKPVQGQKWSVGCSLAGELVGVAIAGRPRAHQLQDGFTIEILRVCTTGARNACSMLYGACCRAAAAMGYLLAVTYTLASEGGGSLRAAGFLPVAAVADRQWNCRARPREERDLVGDKVRWERKL